MLESPQHNTEEKSVTCEIKNLEIEENCWVTYQERIIILPNHRAEKYGIKKIREIDIVDGKGLWWDFCKRITYNHRFGRPNLSTSLAGKNYAIMNDEDYEARRQLALVLKEISGGRITAPDTRIHSFASDLMWREMLDNVTKLSIEKLKSEGLYFQEIDIMKLDEVNSKGKLVIRNVQVLEKDENNNFDLISDRFLSKKEAEDIEKQIRSGEKTYISGLATDGPHFQDWVTYITPTFIFSNKNKVFKKYLDILTKNPDIQKIMVAAKKEEMIDSLKAMRDGLPPIKDASKEFYIPILKNTGTDLPILRWCHAEIAIFPVYNFDAQIKILFFEND